MNNPPIPDSKPGIPGQPAEHAPKVDPVLRYPPIKGKLNPNGDALLHHKKNSGKEKTSK
jgi:hypothetical protein